MARPRKGQDSAAGDPAPSPTSKAPAPAGGPTAKPCPSCGKAVQLFRGGKASYCPDCAHAFDEHGQGRPMDFADRVDALWEARNRPANDPRVDSLDALVKKLSPDLLGKKVGLDDVDPDEIDTNDPATKSKLTMIGGLLRNSLGAMFKGRKRETPSPAPAALPATAGKS